MFSLSSFPSTDPTPRFGYKSSPAWAMFRVEPNLYLPLQNPIAVIPVPISVVLSELFLTVL